jgi:SAM-dependent methyltransferase
MRGPELLAWLASLPPESRDAALEERLGIAAAPAATPPGEHLVGYHASGVAPIVRMLLEVPVVAGDVLVDLGSGLGKVVLLTHLLTGAVARGIELQPALAARAREAAAELGVDVSFTEGDVRDAELGDGTVFFLYLPFTGPVLEEVMDRLRRVASRRAVVVGCLGVDVDRIAPWLSRRPLDSFWLALYDSVEPGGAARRPPARSRIAGPAADAVAFERRIVGG